MSGISGAFEVLQRVLPEPQLDGISIFHLFQQ
jgi:hypothetical protein